MIRCILIPKSLPLIIYISKVKLLTLVKGDPKAPFSIATTPKCSGGCYSIPWIAPLYPWSLPYNAECWARQYQVIFFESLIWLDLGLNPGLPDHWRTLYSLGHWLDIYIYIYIYIYCHPQRDCFFVSQLFSLARHVGCLKLGSKPAWFYVGLSIITLSQQANHVSSGIIRHYVVAFVCLHFYLTRYQSAQFIQRALYYNDNQ